MMMLKILKKTTNLKLRSIKGQLYEKVLPAFCTPLLVFGSEKGQRISESKKAAGN